MVRCRLEYPWKNVRHKTALGWWATTFANVGAGCSWKRQDWGYALSQLDIIKEGSSGKKNEAEIQQSSIFQADFGAQSLPRLDILRNKKFANLNNCLPFLFCVFMWLSQIIYGIKKLQLGDPRDPNNSMHNDNYSHYLIQK